MFPVAPRVDPELLGFLPPEQAVNAIKADKITKLLIVPHCSLFWGAQLIGGEIHVGTGTAV